MDRLFPLNAATIALSGLGVISATLIRHIVRRNNTAKGLELRKDLLFLEAFEVMKAFFEKAALHTVEDLQAFGNGWVPSPFWVRVIRVVIPLSTRIDAGEVLIKTLGEDEIRDVVGGREWWQRTAQKEGGITGEWISMKKDWEGLPDADDEEADPEGVDRKRAEALRKMKQEAKKQEKSERKQGQASEARWKKEDRADERRRKNGDTDTEAEDVLDGGPEEDVGGNEAEYSEEMDEMRCLLYIHGGGYFFGSINTHRYSIWRYTRKIGGRAFAINYRLAPQYPFPCALADALASYIYLIRPPPEAKHKPVDPSKITLAGDSAGGGLCLALLCLIRDSGLPAPAGAVLISPWCDLTHSFPSILENTATDIIPAYGWLFKPSTLWPPPPAEFQARANKSTSLPGLQKAAKESEKVAEEKRERRGFLSLPRNGAAKKGEELAQKVNAGDVKHPHAGQPQASEGTTDQSGDAKAEVGKILKVQVDGEEVEVRDQIQLYATNEQLAYPFVSPIWQPSLGGLPPLFIVAGDKEVLRDEIVYMAHRAANPAAYPLRKALLDANPTRAQLAATYPPTKVHLQIYDDVCHDLPLMSFTTPAKYCYRAISSFIKWVTTDLNDTHPISPVSTTDMALPVEHDVRHPDAELHHNLVNETTSNPSQQSSSDGLAAPSSLLGGNSSPDATEGSSLRKRSLRRSRSREKGLKTKVIPGLEKTIYTSTQPFNRPPYVDNMIRERVSISGVVRPLESAGAIKALHLNPEDIGLIKEGPVKRYLAGKAIWDKRFAKTYERVQKRREHHLKKSIAEEASRVSARMKATAKKVASGMSTPNPAASGESSPSQIDDTLPSAPTRTKSPEPLDTPVEGIWELHGENPPPSSIAARKDTLEARKLAHMLDTHYSKIHALHLWSEAQEIGLTASNAGPPRENSELA